MNRVRWLNAEWPIPIRSLSKNIQRMAFTEDSYEGFVLDRARDDYLEARYIERRDYQEVVTDPFGNQRSFERIEFREVGFRASQFFPGIEFIDPHRHINKLLNRLSEAADFRVAITPFSVDILDWAGRLQQALKSDAIVDSLQIGSLRLEQGIFAKAIITGERDVRDAGDLISNGKEYILEKIRVRLTKPFDATIVLSAKGTATVTTEGGTAELIGLLRSSLAEAFARPSGHIVPFAGT